MFFAILLLSWLTWTEAVQPYFPPQITFTMRQNDFNCTFAVDEINQRVFYSENIDSSEKFEIYAMQHFPYATPDSPQSKYYVILNIYQNSMCQYTTAWKYGGADQSFLPKHWFHDNQFQIGNYIVFNSEMIHSNTSASDEDYWYSVNNCTLDSGEPWPCEEIFFKKNTDIPLRYKFIQHSGKHSYQFTVYYSVISIGKPDDRLFEAIPQNWMDNCTDLNLALDFNLTIPTVHLNESIVIPMRLSSPPHRINGNDTMILQWKVYRGRSECLDCIAWEPKQFYFNIENFHQYQNLTITRVKNGPETTLHPVTQGGGYEKVKPFYYLLEFESE